MLTLKVTTVGSSVGLILNKEAQSLLGVKKGDTLHLTPTADGGLRLTPYDPEFAADMKLAERILHDHRDVFRELAK